MPLGGGFCLRCSALQRWAVIFSLGSLSLFESPTPGQKLGIITLSAPEPAQFADMFQLGLKRLAEVGWETRVADTAIAQDGHLTASAEEIRRDFVSLLEDDQIGAIMCSGGGAIANRLLESLPFNEFKKARKPLIGLSNPTLLLNALTKVTNVVTVHGPCVIWDFGSETSMPLASIQQLYQLLRDPSQTFEFEDDDWVVLSGGQAAGQIVAGNLLSLQCLLGTPWEPDWNGKVLFLEDFQKTVHRYDLMLTHMRNVGVFSKISGLIVGESLECEPTNGVDLVSMLTGFVRDLDIPVLYGPRFGHTTDKLSIPIGGYARLNTRRKYISFSGTDI